MVKTINVRGRENLYHSLVELTREEGYRIVDETIPLQFSLMTERGNIEVSLYDRESPDRYIVRTFHQEDDLTAIKLAKLYEDKTSLSFTLIKDEQDRQDIERDKNLAEFKEQNERLDKQVDRLQKKTEKTLRRSIKLERAIKGR